MTRHGITHIVKGLVVLWLALAAGLAQAQTYAYQTDTFNWLAPSAAATTVTWDNTCTSYPNGDDVRAVVNFPGGFTFDFAGTTYTQVRIMSNGMIQFGADAGIHRTYTNTALPAGLPSASGSCPRAVPQNLLAVYWVDINTAPNVSGALVQYELLGTAPNRQFVITWNNVALYGNVSRRYSFQVVLNEDDTFKYQYTVGASDGSEGTVGVQVSSTDYTQYSFKQTFIDATNGTAIKWYRADQAQPKTAEYYFDEATWRASPNTDVRDASGNGLHGTAIGTAQSSNTQIKVCRSAQFPSNTSNTTQDAVSIPWTPASKGSVSFWYYPGANTDAMLFDASTVANRPFYLMKTAGQQLKLVVSDSTGATVTATTTAAAIGSGSWKHIAVSWYMQAGTSQTVLRIYVNGVLQNVWRGTTNGSPGAVTNAYLGDNRTSGVTPSGGTPNSANGYFDEMKIYPFDMSHVQALKDMVLRSGCSSLDHFDVTVTPAAALTCEWVSVNIYARDSIGGAVQTSTTVSLSNATGHGNWQRGSASGVFAAGAADSGAATYTFNNETNATLLFNTRWAETATLTALASPATGSGNVTFSHEGFKFVTASMAAATVSSKVACVNSNASYAGPPSQTAQTLYLQAWKSDQSNFTCTAANQDFRNGQSVAVNFSMQCVNPATCVGGTNATVNGTAVGLAPNVAGRPNSGDYQPVTLTFGSNAMAPVVINYPDAGQVQLWASYNPGGAPSNHMNGVTNAFAVAPASFTITSVKNSSGTANPIAWPSSGTPTLATAGFAPAGDTLAVTMDAMNACATPAKTFNFGNESTAPTDTRHGGGTFAFSIGAGNATPTVSVPAPVTVTAPVFANGTTSTAAGVRWDEVGAFKATVTLSDYFGAGSVRGTSDWVGRFYPHHFDTVVTPAAGCTGFAYSRQPFTVQVTARNAVTPTAGTTRNYDGTAGFARAVNLTEENGAAGSLYVGSTAGGTGAVPAAQFASGVGTVSNTATANPSPISFRFTTEPSNPAAIAVHAEDSDTLPTKATHGGTDGTLTVESGRLWLGNAYGSEFLPLTVPAQTQFWLANAWRQNTADSCTALNVPTAGNGGLLFYAASARNALAAGEVVAQINGSTAAARQAVTAGDVRLVLRNPASAAQGPGAGNFGYLDVIIANLVGGGSGAPTWLTTTGNGRACFGTCGPRSPIIHSRENF
mgnify:CR=1 FL=1